MATQPETLLTKIRKDGLSAVVLEGAKWVWNTYLAAHFLPAWLTAVGVVGGVLTYLSRVDPLYIGVGLMWFVAGGVLIAKLAGGRDGKGSWATVSPAAAPAGGTPQLVDPAGIMLADMRADIHRVGGAAPWLEFHCTGFNGSGGRVFLQGAEGRIMYKGDEFHGKLELEHRLGTIEPNTLFLFTLRLPLSTNETGHIAGDAEDRHLVVDFKGAALIGTSEQGATFKVPVLRTVQFIRADGNASPPYPAQTLSRLR